MKASPLIIVLICLIVVMLFASSAVSDVDLTPDTPPAATPANDSFAPLSAPLTSLSAGACGGVYSVQSGDTLSAIARQCGVSLGDLLAANPSISDPNLIRPGQQLRLPAASQPVAASPETGGPESAAPETGVQAAPTLPPASELPADQPVEQPTVVAPAAALPSEVPGVKPGDELTVEIVNLPPQVRVRVGMGPQGGAMTILGETITDQVGRLRTEVTIPPEARVGEVWFVAAITLQEPFATVNSAPFQIGGIP